MRAHSSLRLGTLHGTTPELLASPWYCAWGFCMVWEAGSPTRRPLLPLNAGTAEPVRVSPPEAVAYLLELLTTGEMLPPWGTPAVGGDRAPWSIKPLRSHCDNPTVFIGMWASSQAKARLSTKPWISPSQLQV